MARIDHIEIAGNHDPEGPPVHHNNVWLIGDDQQVIVVDPAHDLEACVEAVAGREVVAILITHGHWDHCRIAPEFAARVHAPIFLSERDCFLWEASTGRPDGFVPLTDGATFTVADVTVRAVAVPGHTPGSTALIASDLGAAFVGDALFPGGPGATRWEYSSFDDAIASIRDRLFTLPPAMAVHPGHGASTTIGAESPHLQEWIARGW